MATIVDAICSELKNDAGVSAIVGANVFDTFAPPGSSVDVPYVTVQDLPGGSEARDQTAASGLTYKRIQINAYAASAKLARTAGDAVIAAIGEVNRATIGVTPNDLAVRSLLLLDDFTDDAGQPKDSSGWPVFIHRMDFEAWYTRE